MTALGLGAAMLACGGLGYGWSRAGSLLLLVLSCLWVYVDVRPEGAVLWEITDHHGVVLMDMWGVAGFLAGSALLVRGPRPRHPPAS